MSCRPARHGAPSGSAPVSPTPTAGIRSSRPLRSRPWRSSRPAGSSSASASVARASGAAGYRRQPALQRAGGCRRHRRAPAARGTGRAPAASIRSTARAPMVARPAPAGDRGPRATGEDWSTATRLPAAVGEAHRGAAGLRCIGALSEPRRRSRHLSGLVAVSRADGAIEDAIRPHFSYATVDMPAETGPQLGISDATARVSASDVVDGIDAAGEHVPRSVVARAAVVGPPESIIRQLRDVRAQAAPELFLLPIHDHADGDWFIPHAAALLRLRASAPSPNTDRPIDNGGTRHALDPHHRPRGRDRRPGRSLCLAGATPRSADGVHAARSLAPEVVHARLTLYRASERSFSALTSFQKVLLAYVTSVANETPHCVSQVRLKLIELGTSEAIIAALDDARFEVLQPADAALAGMPGA